jgi:4-hydroxy-3-methylbut-2-enyl diphosphate reductase
MKITIDPYAGFCFGVERAVRIAEDNIFGDIPLRSLGDLVHNEEENLRLKEKGLKTIDHDLFLNIKHGRVLFRAHGEPPVSYKVACRNNTKVIDATCPVVKKLQSRVAKASKEIGKKDGAIIIFGKKKHPEVLGMIGHTAGNVLVISDITEAMEAELPPVIRMFAQTTMAVSDYLLIQDVVNKRLNEIYGPGQIDFKSFNTICGQVSDREKNIRKFAVEHDAIIFVAGKESSNGKMLYNIAAEVNPRSYFISRIDQISADWFKKVASVGVTGATSTPVWLIEKVGKALERF